ncbi:hypothetical protein ACFLTP_10700 [Chloroflexota bacterium]
MVVISSPLSRRVVNSISQLVTDFQKYPERYWNERDIHWSLFYYLKHTQVCTEAYPTQLIRSELPTLKVFNGKRPARGHYDLAILDSHTPNLTEVLGRQNQISWDEFLKAIKIDAAIEIKMWQSRQRQVRIEELIGWDIKKLTDEPNNINNAYFLNFVQLDFANKHMKDYYHKLREYLGNQKNKWPDLNILCVPNDLQIQPGLKDNWL